MKAFVAAWHFPPTTTSESIVTFKLLRNSKTDYDVYTTTCSRYSYDKVSELEADNINVIRVDEEDGEKWTNIVVEKYLENPEQYDYIMTRTMPEFGHECGLIIKEKRPDTYWVASFSDPLWDSPYLLCDLLPKGIFNGLREKIKRDPAGMIPKFVKIRPKLNKVLELKEYQEKVIEKSDVLIFNNKYQAKLMLGEKYNEYINKVIFVPHAYDLDMYPKVKERDDNKLIFSFVGHTDEYRNLHSLFDALAEIRKEQPEKLKNIEFNFYGYIDHTSQAAAKKNKLMDIVSIGKGMTYGDSLKLYLNSDVLINVDAKFNFIDDGNTCLFFASKISDYLGAMKPIFGLTAHKGPSVDIFKATNNVYCDVGNVEDVKEKLLYIIDKKGKIDINKSEYKKYDAVIVSKEYDEEIEKRIKNNVN